MVHGKDERRTAEGNARETACGGPESVRGLVPPQGLAGHKAAGGTSDEAEEREVSKPEVCECGALIVYINGQRWCAQTRAKYIAVYGIPESEKRPNNQKGE